MKRRDALRNIGLGGSAIFLTPSIVSLFQSCSSDLKQEWKPVFFTKSSGFALKNILEVIIPTTDSPGATDLNLEQFIDLYINEVYDDLEKDKLKKSADAFETAFKYEYDKDLESGDFSEYEKIVDKYLKSSAAQRKEFQLTMYGAADEKEPVEPSDLNESEGSFAYLRNLRGLAIWAWKTNEVIGEEFLYYDPVPGQYIACAKINEVSNGKTMSL